MNKRILSIFMAIVICMMTVTVTYAHANEGIALSTRSTCPDCRADSYRGYCGGAYVDSDDGYETCTDSDGCRIISVQYTTVYRCSRCGYQRESAPHTHVVHTVCVRDDEGCEFGSAIAK